LKRPQPTGVGRQSLSLARNILSAEQLKGVDDKISKKADSIKASNLCKAGITRCGGTVAHKKDINFDAQHVSNL
jgi:hypothetical protein